MRRACITPHCPNPATQGARCTTCTRTNDRHTHRAGYHIYRTKRWQMTRRHYLLKHPLCQHDGCNEIATDVHHRTDLTDGGNPYATDNLEALCHPHHSQITRSRQRTPA